MYTEMPVRGFSVAARCRRAVGSPSVVYRARSCPVPLGVAAISRAEWTVLLAGWRRCVFIGQARTVHSFEAGEYRRRDIPHRGIAQVPSAPAAERANCTRK